MTDKEQTELLTAVLQALLGDQFKGKFLVEIKMTTTLDADSIADAKAKGLEYAKAHPEQWQAWAIKTESLIHKE